MPGDRDAEGLALRIERVARRHVEARLPADDSGELAAMDLPNLLMVYGNWKGRFVPRRPRTVHLSRELQRELSASPHKEAVETISAEIAAGDDLAPRLSKGVDVAYVPQAERKSGRGIDRDLDVQLAHDGLHHLHLGPHIGGRFVQRSADLLFAAFRENDAYLVGVYPHGSWGRKELLERMVRNWPDAGLLHRMAGMGLVQDTSDEDRWEMMKAGVMVLVEIDGSVYFAPGQTTAGTPSRVTQRVNAIMWQLTSLRENGLRAILESVGANPNLYWVPAIRDEQPGLGSSKGFVGFGRLA